MECVVTMSNPHQSEPFAFEDDTWAECQALAQTLNKIGDKWTVMVIGALRYGPQRFNTLRRSVGGVSHRMLTLTLRSLERDGLVTRTIYPTIPPKVEYALTEIGDSLVVHLRAISSWEISYRAAIAHAQARFDALAKPSKE